jgi:DNA-directed RNA polymerase subunit RPC12/RpoP
MKVVCSDCGQMIKVELEGEIYNPANCPNCGSKIIKVKNSPTSNDKVAIVEKNV